MTQHLILYTLDPLTNVPLPCFDYLAWALWHGTNQERRRVALDTHADWRVSTVFLGHAFGRGDPLLFETMVFLPDNEPGQMARYRTWAEAQAGHERIKSMLEREWSDAHKLSMHALTRLLTVDAAARADLNETQSSAPPTGA